MELVQKMEHTAVQRDSFLYIEQMEQILYAKLESINSLRSELKSFQKFLNKLVYYIQSIIIYY